MILSVSRRTDIPAFYTEWFFNRLKEGFVYVRNPFNKNMVSKISLDSKDIDFIVFWTKNPLNILNRITELNTYKIPYYFQITITAYGKDIETNIGDKFEIIEAFKKLSSLIGSEKVIWRYDPILITEKYSLTYHLEKFEFLAKELNAYTKKCIISFIDLYDKCKRNMKHIELKDIGNDEKIKLAMDMAKIAQKYDIELLSCAEDIELDTVGIKHGKCIDDVLISQILGTELKISKDKNQRGRCNCVESVDIGEYNTCSHNCLYCYANFNADIVKKNIGLHDPHSTLLVGEIKERDVIKVRKACNFLGVLH